MGVPIVYRRASENIINNYNFIDVATGRGVLQLYGGDILNNATSDYVLSTQKFYGDSGYATVTVGIASATEVKFAITFKRPITINGDALINIPWRKQGAGTTETRCDIYLYKNSTTLVSGSAVVTKNFNANEGHVFAVKLALPKTIFATGDVFKLGLLRATSAGTTDWYNDPQNRTTINAAAQTGIESSQLSIQLPVIVDL